MHGTQNCGARRSLTAILAALLVCAAVAAPQPSKSATGAYAVDATKVLGGDGFWDYLSYDPSGKRIFISRGTHVMVVDAADGSVKGDIPGTAGVHGIALAPELGRGYTSNGRDNSVTVFNLASLQTLATVAIPGKNPDCIVYDAATKRIITFNGGSNDATVIDATNNTVLGSIPLPGRPEFAAVDGTGTIFDNIEDKNEMVRIDARAMKLTGTYALTGCDGPSGLSMDTVHRRLFAGCGNKVMAVVNADTGAIVATPAIGDGSDATAFDSVAGNALSSNGEGTMTVVHEDSPDHYSVTQTLTTKKYARTLAVAPDAGRVYLVTADVTVTPPTAGQTRPTRAMAPGSFALVVVSRASH